MAPGLRGWLLAFGIALSIASSAAADAAGEDRRLTLLVTAGLSGRLVEEGGGTVAPLATAVRREAEAARSDGREVVVLDAGRTLVPYAESRFDGGRTMLRVLEAAGCQVFAPSALDLSLGLADLERLASEASFPVLRPFVGGTGAEGLVASAVLELANGLRLEVADLFDPAFGGDLIDFGAAGAVPRGPQAALEESAGDTDVRVAVLHSKLHSKHLERRSLSWRLVEEPHGIDLVINPDLGHDLTLRRETEDGPVVLVGFELRDDRPWMAWRIDLELESRASGWRIGSAASRVVTYDDASADPGLEAEVRRAFARFRETHSDPLAPGAPTDRAGLERFVLEAVREAARAEVSVLSRGALRPVPPRLFETPPLRREAVLRLLSLDLEIGVATLTGEELVELVEESAGRRYADGSPRKDSLEFFGLTYELTGDGADAMVHGIEVNGRPLHPEDGYRVATSSYLLAGGDGYQQLTGLEAEILRAPGASRRRGARREASRPAELRDDIVLPRLEQAGESFVDLRRRSLWRFGLDEISLFVDGVETRRDPAYDGAPDSRANADDSSTVRAQLRLWADQEFLGWSWQNRLRASFGLVDTAGTERREVDDDLRFESSALFSKLRFFGGDPFIGVIVDSEFRRNRTSDGSVRPRQLEQALSAGLEWSTKRWRRLRFGMLARHYSNSDLADRLGFELEALYLKKPRGSRPGFEGRFFFDSLRDGSASIDRLDVDLRLLMPVWNALELRPAFNYYTYRDSQLPGSADYYRFSLGFAYAWAGKYQNLD